VKQPTLLKDAAARHRWQVLAVTAVAVFMSFLDVTIVNIAFPNLRADFATTSLPVLSWVINGYGVVFAAALIPAGRLADRIGRRRLFLAGIVVFLLASALCGLAPNPAVLIAARVVQALGAAAVVPTSLALLLPEFPLARRATATAIWGGHRSGRCGDRTGAGRGPGRLGGLAAGVLRQRAHRHRRAGPGPAPAGGEPRSAGVADPGLVGCRAAGPGGRRVGAGDRPGSQLGLG